MANVLSHLHVDDVLPISPGSCFIRDPCIVIGTPMLINNDQVIYLNNLRQNFAETL